MVRLKMKGYNFPELEAKGWLEGWLDDDEQEFLDQEEDQYKDWTIKDLQNFDKFQAPVQKNEGITEQALKIQKQRIMNTRDRMQGKFDEIARLKQQQDVAAPQPSK